jgi:hypothetical protein
MNDNVINVSSNLNQTQWILTCLSHVEAINVCTLNNVLNINHLICQKCLSKYGNDCFTIFNWNTIVQIFECYHSPLMENFIFFAFKFKIMIIHAFDNSNLKVKKKHYTLINSMIHNFLEAQKWTMRTLDILLPQMNTSIL